MTKMLATLIGVLAGFAMSPLAAEELGPTGSMAVKESQPSVAAVALNVGVPTAPPPGLRIAPANITNEMPEGRTAPYRPGSGASVSFAMSSDLAAAFSVSGAAASPTTASGIHNSVDVSRASSGLSTAVEPNQARESSAPRPALGR